MTHLLKQDIEEILAKYSLSVQELIAGVTPFNDGQEAPRYRNSATQDLLALIHKACNQARIDENEYWLGVTGNDVPHICFEDFENRIKELKELNNEL